MRALSRDEVRSVDRRAVEEYGMPSLVLMENAGRGAAEWLAGRMAGGGKVVIVAGQGNNGGDGGAVARHLELRGITVAIRWVGDLSRFSVDAAAQYAILEQADVDQQAWADGVDGEELKRLLAGADWVVDGLLGTGLTRPVEPGPIWDAIGAINASGRPVLALDVPSGLDADTGDVLGVSVKAAATVTFVAEKIGFAGPGASDYTGEVVVAGIGVPLRLLREVGAG